MPLSLRSFDAPPAQPRSERDVVIRRFRIVEQFLNHNWKAEGSPSKREHLRVIAKRNQTSARNIYRWIKEWKETKDRLSLADRLPGPKPGTGTVLDDDMKAHLQDCWTLKKLTVRQSHASLVRYLTAKQNSPGCRVDHLYRIPSYPTVARFIDSLDALNHAARQGAEKLRAACGYIDRTYGGLKSLERVETDEWKYDVFAYPRRNPQKVTRFWLLTFYDERSIYPLAWKLVEGELFDKRHGIKEADEIDLLACLLREFGVPGTLVSDRGRFRTGTFGGEKRTAQFAEADGIPDRLGIRHDTPREKNPQGNRLERFHRFLADKCRELSAHGWIGANDQDREMTHGDEHAELHQRWAAGDPAVPKTPLLSSDELRLKTDEWMEEWRDHASEGTDRHGLSPRAVFVHNTPEGGFKKLTDKEIDWNTTEHFKDVTVRTGGIIQLRDGKRYSSPALILIQGEKREVARSRFDHSRISALPARKGEEVITAKRREPVGTSDPDELATQMELKKRVRNLAGEMVNPLPYDPGSQFSTVDARPAASSPIEEVERVPKVKAIPMSSDLVVDGV